MTQEALRMALEALKTLHDENMDYLTRNKLGGENNQCMVFARQAITAIKEALAQTEQEPVGDEWTPCIKLPVMVHVRKQRPGETHVSTREGITPVNTEDLIMRGLSGEEYPIGRAIFEQTYSLDITQPKQEQKLVGTVGDLFDDRVIAHRKLDRDLLVYTAAP